jgi:hypothetical protein
MLDERLFPPAPPAAELKNKERRRAPKERR